MALSLRSPGFRHNEEIPSQFTCEGEDTIPPLEWSGVPAGAKSLALIVDDPDAPDPKAPRRTFVHWVVYGIPPEVTSVSEETGVPAGAREGKNDAKGDGYTGPCPPIGRHRYFFKLYALDTMLGPLRPATKQALEQAMQGHVLEQAELVGTYALRRTR